MNKFVGVTVPLSTGPLVKSCSKSIHFCESLEVKLVGEGVIEAGDSNDDVDHCGHEDETAGEVVDPARLVLVLAWPGGVVR